MEGFVHPTKRQRLQVVSSSLRRAFGSTDAVHRYSFEEYLRRLDEAERAVSRGEKEG
jgi:hypothetical protein